ncbi:flavin-containing monooxygenase [Lindgomyces ingoldianus]|uniref:Flavin-containing monooxygenase n=1 Tax=Lindgomyces ingoldianus TaxID=673940 RepID=A0ACB6QRK7_9PLEO|nr:flavin-containing monooxygenase [Lindgomyces ingoldianus]KAF2469618.1 flavin-containing monooxygenase [Lindgomyces ingoldianus]
MKTLRARTIAIIGAGPSGIVAAKYFRAEKAFDKICIFEQRSSVGGIWNYTPEDRNEDIFTVPQTNPRGENQDPVWREASATSNLGDGHVTSKVNGAGGGKVASFLSPVYERLETNIPRGLMGFQDLDWPADSQLFPKHETVLEYIEEYARDIQDLISYETQVINVEPADEEYGGKWTVKTRYLPSNEETEEVFDAVVVANGHFIVPYIPDIPGIAEWHKRFPGSITHSKYFRTPEEFAGKKVIVVGNSASGIDLSSQIADLSQLPLLWSSKSTSMFKPSSSPLKREVPPIAEFFPKTQEVAFEDGTIASDIDAVIFATGYFYSLPFLETVKPELIGDGSHIQHTYQHLFYAPRPTLAFLTLPQRIIPFPIAEAQSAVLARVFSDRLSLPPYAKMQNWEESVVEEMGDGRNFHILAFPKDGNYVNELANWASTATRREGLENEGKGKMPPVWGEWEFWCRGRFPEIKKAFGEMGEERWKVRSMEELGFRFEECLRSI